MAGNPSGPNTAVTGKSAKTPAMGTVPATGSLPATQQPPFSTKGTWHGPWKRSRTQQNGAVSTRRLPCLGPAYATPAAAAATSGKYEGRISTSTSGDAIREPTPFHHQLLILLVPWVCGQCPAQHHDVHELRTGTPDQRDSPKHNGRQSGGGTMC